MPLCNSSGSLFLTSRATTCGFSSTISQQAQIQLLYDKSQLNGLRAPALSGHYSAQTALQKILIGSGLELVNENGVFVIRTQNLNQGTLVLPETQVSGVVQNHPATDVISAPQYVTAEEISGGR